MRRATLASSILLLVGLGVAPPGAAEAGPEAEPGPLAAAPAPAAREGARRINLAGRQRMLTQRMAKAACFAAIGLEAERHIEMMAEAQALFERTLAGLDLGDREQGLVSEADARVLDGLVQVRLAWEPYGEAVARAVAERLVTRESLIAIAELNLPVLAETNRTVGLVERAYGGRSVPLGQAIALNIADRQRMLTQKMSKEVCLIAQGIEAETHRAALAESVALFDTALLALMEGAPDVGIRPPSRQDLAYQLVDVAAIWERLKPAFAKIVAGAAPGFREVAAIAAENDRLLAEMNRAVFLYEKE